MGDPGGGGDGLFDGPGGPVTGDGYGGWLHPDPAGTCPLAPRGHRTHAAAVSCETDSMLIAAKRRRHAAPPPPPAWEETQSRWLGIGEEFAP